MFDHVTKLPDDLPHTWQSELELSVSLHAHLEPRKYARCNYIVFLFIIGHLKTKLIFHSHDHLHMVQTVKTKIIDKMTVQSQLVGSDFVKSFTNIQNSTLNFFLAESRRKSFDWKISPSRMLWSKFKIQT